MTRPDEPSVQVPVSLPTSRRLYNRDITIFVDQDGPLADFESSARAQNLDPKDAKMQRGFYEELAVVDGATDAMRELIAMPHVQVFVATKIPNRNPHAATEKLLWIHRYFPELEERVIITPNKGCLGKIGDYLIDDRAHKADASFFPGQFIHFLTPAFPDWAAVMAHLRVELRVTPGAKRAQRSNP